VSVTVSAMVRVSKFDLLAVIIWLHYVSPSGE